MSNLRRIGLLSACCLFSATVFAARVGPEVPVTVSDGDQRNVVVSRDGTRTLLAFDETPAAGVPTRVIVHQYEARMGVLLGRETFAVESSAHHQRRPFLDGSMVAWMEEDPATNTASVWWHQLGEATVGSNFAPVDSKERVGDARPGTRVSVVSGGGLPVIVWTAPGGQLNGVYRAIIIRIGYDRSVFNITSKPASNPAAGGFSWGNHGAVLAFNRPETLPGCDSCVPRYAIDATMVSGMAPQATVEIAPAGASAPRVVFDGKDFIVFWSETQGGTFAQRVHTSLIGPVKIGGVTKVHDGVLHDAALAVNGGGFLMVVERDSKFDFLRLDSGLSVTERAPFHARLAPDSKISVSRDDYGVSLLAYAAERPGLGSSAQAVFRIVEQGVSSPRRRSVR